jgi:Fur family transcriptional regulator, peroxide stress response regulator
MAISKAEIERRMRRFTETCQANGLKITHQRTEVFHELAGTEDHPDAETIYQNVRRRVPAISRDTVYRTLATLEEHGLIRKAEILSSRGRYDANTERHHHFICTECGRVRDFYSDKLDELPIPKSVATLGRVESSHVQLRGTCSTCARGKK